MSDSLTARSTALELAFAPGERPGIVGGPRPERIDVEKPRLVEMARTLAGFGFAWRRVSEAQVARFEARVDAAAAGLADIDDDGFDQSVDALRRALRRHGIREPWVSRGFAIVREAARRTLATPHYGVQLHGGWTMLHNGLAELETGEGKTLTATLPASIAGLAGLSVHVITANDYLVERDSNAMAPVYERLGLSVSHVIESEPDRDARRQAYASDITYVTNKQAAFDYLRDRLDGGGERGLRRALLGDDGLEAPVMRGLCFAIVDEADSVLIDDAATPLILSGPGTPVDTEVVRDALVLARELEEGRDYRIARRRSRIVITEAGEARLGALASDLAAPLRGEHRRREWVERALAAERLYERDHHYVVRDGAIHIIDLPTGRRSVDRAFESGVQSLIEVREGLEPTPQRETIARISYQRFFGRYLRLAGMTGTAREIAREVWNVYGLRTFTIPTRKPSLRRARRRRVLPDRLAHAEAVVERIEALHREGRPVLVGTADVASAELLSERLEALGLEHAMLSANQDEHEASVIARAGERARITIATRMAGRGTDITLGPSVAELGGLAVISTELAEARRIDRQLFGRCGRQGEPGSYEQIVSLEDRRIELHVPDRFCRLLTHSRADSRIVFWLTRAAQMVEERRSALARLRLSQSERSFDELLSFTARRD